MTTPCRAPTARRESACCYADDICLDSHLCLPQVLVHVSKNESPLLRNKIQKGDISGAGSTLLPSRLGLQTRPSILKGNTDSESLNSSGNQPSSTEEVAQITRGKVTTAPNTVRMVSPTASIGPRHDTTSTDNATIQVNSDDGIGSFPSSPTESCRNAVNFTGGAGDDATQGSSSPFAIPGRIGDRQAHTGLDGTERHQRRRYHRQHQHRDSHRHRHRLGQRGGGLEGSGGDRSWCGGCPWV